MTARTNPGRAAKLDRLMPADEAARALGLCERSLRRLAQRGEIQVVRAGKRALRYRETDICRLQREGWSG